jgi:hypothetical protein
MRTCRFRCLCYRDDVYQLKFPHPHRQSGLKRKHVEAELIFYRMTHPDTTQTLREFRLNFRTVAQLTTHLYAIDLPSSRYTAEILQNAITRR